MALARLRPGSRLMKPLFAECHLRRFEHSTSLKRLITYPVLSHVRRFSSRRMYKFFENTIRYRVPQGYVQVYQSPMTNYVYLLCIGVFVGTVSFIPMFVALMSKHQWVSEYNKDASVLLRQFFEHEYEAYAFIASFVVLLVGLHLLVQRHPMRIYYNTSSKHFLAYFLRFVPSTVRTVRYGHGEMRVLAGMSEFRTKVVQDNYAVGHRRFILDEKGFQTLYYFNLMLGYVDEEEVNDDDNDF